MPDKDISHSCENEDDDLPVWLAAVGTYLLPPAVPKHKLGKAVVQLDLPCPWGCKQANIAAYGQVCEEDPGLPHQGGGVVYLQRHGGLAAHHPRVEGVQSHAADPSGAGGGQVHG